MASVKQPETTIVSFAAWRLAVGHQKAVDEVPPPACQAQVLVSPACPWPPECFSFVHQTLVPVVYETVF